MHKIIEQSVNYLLYHPDRGYLYVDPVHAIFELMRNLKHTDNPLEAYKFTFEEGSEVKFNDSIVQFMLNGYSIHKLTNTVEISKINE